MSTDVAVLVSKVNQILLEGEPGNISVDEHSSYNATGYEPQSVIDAMNDGIGIGNWGFEEVSSEIVTSAKGSQMAIAQIKVWLAGVEFKPVAWGQSKVVGENIGDGKKGAQTDAIKKALSYFSIGNRAYHGLLEKNKKPAAQPARPAPARVVDAAPASNGHAEPSKPTNIINAPTPSQLRKMFASIGKSLDLAQKLTFKGIIKPEDNLTPEECHTLKQVYDNWKKALDEKAKAS